MGPNPIGLMPLKEKTNLDKDTDTQRGEEHVDRDGNWGDLCISQGTLTLREARKGLPAAFRGGVALPTP